ncbi:TIM barrel protein [soil metagenome]
MSTAGRAHPPLSFAMSILLSSVPLLERAGQAIDSGYRQLESWWPWSESEPSAREIASFAATVVDRGARLYLLNLTEGPPEYGGRGLAGVPAQESAFWSNSGAALELGGLAGTRYLNVLAGNIQSEGAQAGLAVLEERLVALADRAADSGIGLLLEQLNPHDHPDYLLVDPQVTLEVLARVRRRTRGRVGMLADVYHLARSGVDPVAFIAEHHAAIGHVQLADYPGRGRPGSGRLPIAGVLETLRRNDYEGLIGLEYLPGGEDVPAPEEFWRYLNERKAS